MPDFHMQVVRLIEEGDDVFVHWHLTGTHSGGPFQGIAPTGRAIALDGMDHFVMRDGVVVSNFVVYDQMQFARQIGLLPRDGSAADRALKAAFGLKSRLSRRRP
jgi:predicted ester cyclase